MGTIPARISVRLGQKVTHVSSSKRNPRGVHYRSGEVAVLSAGLSRAELGTAVAEAIERLFPVSDD